MCLWFWKTRLECRTLFQAGSVFFFVLQKIARGWKDKSDLRYLYTGVASWGKTHSVRGLPNAGSHGIFHLLIIGTWLFAPGLDGMDGPVRVCWKNWFRGRVHSEGECKGISWPLCVLSQISSLTVYACLLLPTDLSLISFSSFSFSSPLPFFTKISFSVTSLSSLSFHQKKKLTPQFDTSPPLSPLVSFLLSCLFAFFISETLGAAEWYGSNHIGLIRDGLGGVGECNGFTKNNLAGLLVRWVVGGHLC